MEKDTHSYIIIALLIAILVLLVVVFVEQKKTTTNLLGQVNERLENCEEDIAKWQQQHPAGTTVDEPARNELSSILNNCSTAIK